MDRTTQGAWCSHVGAGAYSVYLTQKIAFHLLLVGAVSSFGTTGYAKLSIALLAVAVMGAALYWLVERPFLQLRDRLDGSQRVVTA